MKPFTFIAFIINTSPCHPFLEQNIKSIHLKLELISNLPKLYLFCPLWINLVKYIQRTMKGLVSNITLMIIVIQLELIRIINLFIFSLNRSSHFINKPQFVVQFIQLFLYFVHFLLWLLQVFHFLLKVNLVNLRWDRWFVIYCTRWFYKLD